MPGISGRFSSKRASSPRRCSRKALTSTTKPAVPWDASSLRRTWFEERDLVRVLAKNIGIEFVDLDEGAVDPAAAALIPEALARRYAALPIGFDDEKLVVAMADPANVLADRRHPGDLRARGSPEGRDPFRCRGGRISDGFP